MDDGSQYLTCLSFYVLAEYLLLSSLRENSNWTWSYRNRSRNNARSLGMTEHIRHLTVIDFPNFKLCPVIMWTKNWKLFTSFLGFKVFINKVEITNSEDVYLPRNITNYNVCAPLSTCNPSQMTWWKLGQQNNSPVRDWLLKTFDAHDLGIQKIQCLT